MHFPHRKLGEPAFERLREQVAVAAALCDDEQVLELADCLHSILRRRRSQRSEGASPPPPRSFAPARPGALQASS